MFPIGELSAAAHLCRVKFKSARIAGIVPDAGYCDFNWDQMNTLHKFGGLAGVIGVLLCAASIAFRLTGAFWIDSYHLGTLLQAGTATMVFGCFCFLAVLTQRE